MIYAVRLEIGGIYILSPDWKPYNDPIYNSRPVIVIKRCKSYVESVSLDISFQNSQKEKQLFIEYYIDGNKRISIVSCDRVQKIPYKYFNEKIGIVDDNILEAIILKAFKDDSVNKIFNGLTISNEDKFNIMMYNNQMRMSRLIIDKISATQDLIKEPRKAINVLRDFSLGVVTGIASSIIATILWQNYKDIFILIINNLKNLIMY